MSAAERVVLPVGGMTCAACVSHVEGALQKVSGVSGASVNLITRSATVDFDPSATDADTLVRAVVASGYDAALPGPDRNVLDEQRALDHDTRHEVRRFVVRAAVALSSSVVVMVASAPLMEHGDEHAGHAAHGALVSMDPVSAALMNAMAAPARAFFPGLYDLPRGALGIALLAFTVVVSTVVGWPIARRAWGSLRRGATDMNTLVTLGVLAALMLSAAAVLVPGVFVNAGVLPEVYFEAALMILGFILVGNALEARAKKQTTAALAGLAALEPSAAVLEVDGVAQEIPLEQVRRGDTLILKPGARAPVDGVVTDGRSDLDESLVTGEPMPVAKNVGDAVIAGTLNGSGLLRVRATSLAADSSLAQLVQLMRDAQGQKAPTQALADRVARVFTPAVIALSVVTAVGWLLLGASWPQAVVAAVTVLVAACPCAMGLAVPTALMVATGHAARLGVVWKGGQALEQLAHVDTFVFDKTGTLTEGKPQLVHAEGVDGIDVDQTLARAAAVEQGSEHPLARAVVDEAKRRGLRVPRAKEITASAGLGVRGAVGVAGSRVDVAIGNAALVRALGATVPEALQVAADAASQGGATTPFVLEDGRVTALLVVEDPLHGSAAPALATLRANGKRTLLLSGDQVRTAEHVARQVGIDPALGDVRAEVTPAQKLEVIRALKDAGHVVAMVGDGVNDGPALAAADVGIAMARGSDIAVAAADLTLLRHDLGVLPRAQRLAERTLATMRRNLFWAFAYNVVSLPLAMGVLAPLGLRMSPVVASAAMALSSVSVVLSSLWLHVGGPAAAPDDQRTDARKDAP